MFERIKAILGGGTADAALKQQGNLVSEPIRVRRPETLAEYHDHLASLVLTAPDNFREVVSGSLYSDQAAALKANFDVLRSDFHLVESKLRDDHLARICKELIEISSEAYLAGDKRTGAFSLQELCGLIWPSYKLRPKYGVQAELRAFGVNTLYAGVTVSPYPYEGTRADLSRKQEELFALAERSYTAHLNNPEVPTYPDEPTYFSWVITLDGAVKRTSAKPRDDQHPILKPVQRSWGFKRLKELGHSGEIQACVLVQIPLGNPGVIICDVEEGGRPRISVRQKFERQRGVARFEPARYFLEDPSFFPEE